MMKKLMFIILAILLGNVAHSQSMLLHKTGGGIINVKLFEIDSITFVSDTGSAGGTVTDYEGNLYYTETIGTQTWMKQNLKVTKYNNGDDIPTTINISIPNDSTSKYQWAYNNNNIMAETYGRLYTWWAVTDSRNICPIGWHIPTETEWTTLSDYLGGASIAGGKMKEPGTSWWSSPNTGADDSSGFSAIASGYRSNDGIFVGDYLYTYFWSINEYDTLNAWNHGLFYNGADFNSEYNPKNVGFSVRCIKD